MKKNILSLLLSLIVLLNGFSVAHASSETIQITPEFKEEDYLGSRIDNTVYEWGNPTPYYNYVSSTSIGLTLLGNVADCSLTVVGYPEVNKISTYIYLQRYESGKWTTLAGGTFHKQENDTNIFFAPTKTLDKKGSYRFTAEIFVYTKDGNTEYVALASNTEVY